MRNRHAWALLALLALVGTSTAADRFTRGAKVHKAWGGSVPTSGVLVNLVGLATTADPVADGSEQRTNYITVCNRGATQIHVNTGNPTSTGSVDTDISGTPAEIDPPVGPGVCIAFDDALVFQIELASVSGSPIATVFYGRER